MIAAERDQQWHTGDDDVALAPAGDDTADVRIVLRRLEQVQQVEPIIRAVAARHHGRRTYAVIGSLPAAAEWSMADIAAGARRHAFAVVMPAESCDSAVRRWSARDRRGDPGVLFEADLAHAITGTMQWLRPGDAMVVLCVCAATFDIARRAIALGRRWRESFDPAEAGDLSNVPSDPFMPVANGAGT